MTTIEIEDTDGNTICNFIIKGHIKPKDLGLMKDCCLCDEDEDYFNNEINLLRIQLE